MQAVEAPSGALRLSTAKAWLLCGLMLLTLVLSEALRPTHHLSEQREAIHLNEQVPRAFGEWHELPGVTPLLPNPQLQAKLDALYSQLLARTFVNGRGERVYLSIAYGSDQASEATAVHRPEFCYGAQGFRVRDAGQAVLRFGDGQDLRVQRLVATQAPQVEPISYWVTLDNVATLPGLDRKLAQLHYGFRGEIPDGMLVRVSSIGRDEAHAFALQQDFLMALRRALPPRVAPRYFGF